MADIKFLAGLDIDGNINLNKGQLQSAVIHPLASNPSSPAQGQLYYNTGSDELRIYTGSAWIAVGADTDNYVDDGSYDASTGTITLERTGSLADIEITGLLQIGTTSTTALAGNTTTISSAQSTKLGHITVTQAVDLDTMESDVATNNNKTSFPGFGTSAGVALEGDTDLLQIGTTATTAMAGNTTTISSAQSTKLGHISVTQAVDLDDMESDISTNASNISTNTSNISTNTSNISTNTSNISTNTSNISTNTSDISTNTGDISTNTSNISTNASAITGKVGKSGDTMTGALTLSGAPTANLHAATKAYVDSVVTGQLVYQGGYDASAAPPTGASILKGFTYTVTVAGDGNGFFTTELEIGDLIIAEQNNPTTEAHWTEVNKNVTLASTSTVGVASFSSSNFAVSAAGEVTVKNDGIALGTETTGDYVESLTASTNVSISGGSGEGSTPSISVPHANIDDRITKRQHAQLIGGSTSITLDNNDHELGTDSSQFMVQLVEVSSGETVHAEVTRGSSGAVTIGFTSNPGTNAIRILIIKID